MFPNQLDKETQKPSLLWIYRLFYGVQVLTIKIQELDQELVISLNPTLDRAIRLFGKKAREIYRRAT